MFLSGVDSRKLICAVRGQDGTECMVIPSLPVNREHVLPPTCIVAIARIDQQQY